MNEIKERMQIKCNYDDKMMHVQGVAKESHESGNRKYGIALKLRTTLEVSQWLREQTPTHKSAASGDVLYIPFEIRKYKDNNVQFFIMGSKGNHELGVMLDVQPADKDIRQLIKFANNAGLIANIDEDSRWQPTVVDTQEEEE